MTNSEITARMPLLSDFYSDPFPGRKGDERVRVDCGRCNGTGIYQGPSGITFYTPSVQNVTVGCFDCNGHGFRSILVSSARATARKHAKQALESALQDAKAQVAAIAFEQEHPGLLAWLVEFEGGRGFLADMAAKGAQMTPNMVAAVERIRAERAAEAETQAATAPIAEGRRVLVGKVLSVKESFTDFGSAWKMVLDLGDGTRVYGSVGRDIDRAVADMDAPKVDEAWFDRLIGRRVQITATVERSQKDHTFGFYSRPVKGSVLPE